MKSLRLPLNSNAFLFHCNAISPYKVKRTQKRIRVFHCRIVFARIVGDLYGFRMMQYVCNKLEAESPENDKNLENKSLIRLIGAWEHSSIEKN